MPWGGGLWPPAPSSCLARAGWELAERFPSRGAGDAIASVPWEGLSGVFLVVSLSCFSFPAGFSVGKRRLVGILWEAAVVCLSVRLLSILRGWGRRDTGAPGRRDISGAAVAPAGQVCGGFAFPPPYGRCDPRSCHRAGLWCLSRNSSRINSACSVGPNPALSCAGCPGLVCHPSGWVTGVDPLGTGSGLLGPPPRLAAGCGARSSQIHVGKLRSRLGRAGKG